MHRLITVVAGLCAAFTMSSCAEPSYTFVTNSDDQVYFKVPVDWTRIDQKDLDKLATAGLTPEAAASLRARTWSVAFDAGAKPSVGHIFSPEIRAPIVYARVLRTSSGERPSVTLDALRNFVVPVTEEARLAASAKGQLPNGFKLVEDEVKKPGGGLRGVHQVFRYDLGGVAHTFDQTALATKDASRIYLLLVRCTQTCYADRKSELASIVRSFTVKSGP